MAAALLAGAAPLVAEEPAFQVVVHRSNAAARLSRTELARIFLKRTSRWEDGTPVAPVDLAPTSPVRRAFTRQIHGKEVTAIQSYWQRMIFSGREVPPPELGSDRQVLEYVAAHPGAVGYVTTATALPAAVKTLDIGG